jgi:hypothetical protein
MDEQEFDALFQQPFGREDFQRLEAGLGRCGTLAAALFGRTPEDLCRQLVASHPEILRALPWRISGTSNGTRRRFQAWF